MCFGHAFSESSCTLTSCGGLLSHVCYCQANSAQRHVCLRASNIAPSSSTFLLHSCQMTILACYVCIFRCCILRYQKNLRKGFCAFILLFALTILTSLLLSVPTMLTILTSLLSPMPIMTTILTPLLLSMPILPTILTSTDLRLRDAGL